MTSRPTLWQCLLGLRPFHKVKPYLLCSGGGRRWSLTLFFCPRRERRESIAIKHLKAGGSRSVSSTVRICASACSPSDQLRNPAFSSLWLSLIVSYSLFWLHALCLLSTQWAHIQNHDTWARGHGWVTCFSACMQKKMTTFPHITVHSLTWCHSAVVTFSGMLHHFDLWLLTQSAHRDTGLLHFPSSSTASLCLSPGLV